VAHAVHHDAENPQRLVFVEQWASQEALWVHFKVPASRGFAKALAALAVGMPEMALFDAAALLVPGKPGA
jgi:quinol monooxygenase YgiN